MFTLKNPLSYLADRAAFYGIPMDQLSAFLPVALEYIDLRNDDDKSHREACELLSVSDEIWEDTLSDIVDDIHNEPWMVY